MQAKKSLGQNFLINEQIISLIVEQVSAFSNDLILEIGPGRGALTKLLVQKQAYYLGYEIDKNLLPILKQYTSIKAKIINQDFLSADINKDISAINYEHLFIVGNLPYYITTPILEKIIASNINPQKIVIMVQKEVGLRFMGQPKTKDYGYFTCLLQYYFNIIKVCDVLKNNFNPAPKVDSMVLELTPRTNRPNIDVNKYQEFLKTIFKQKRKTLKNNLKGEEWEKIKPVLIKYNLSESVRAEELNEEILLALFKELSI